jgi:hypothetical protein
MGRINQINYLNQSTSRNSKNAIIILDSIRRNDEEQYYAFLGSIDALPYDVVNQQEENIPVNSGGKVN